MLWKQSFYLNQDTNTPDFAGTSGLDHRYLSSRMALRQCLAQATGQTPNWEQLKLVNFQHLLAYPDYLISLSHSQNASLAAVVHKDHYLGVGVDIEAASRKIDPKSARHFQNEKDLNNPSLLDLWVAKEASFKSLSGHRNLWDRPDDQDVGFYLKDMAIEFTTIGEFQFYPLRNPDYRGEGKIWHEKLNREDFKMSLATIKN